MKLVQFCLITCMVLSADYVNAASIGLFSDTSCSSCSLTIPAGTSGTFCVRAVADGLEWGPAILAADFRIEGLPPGWTATAQLAPAATQAIGDPFA